MVTEGSPRIISVTGAHSGVGKTSLCSILLRELKGFGAIKFTKDLFNSSLIDEPDIILQKGKDTAIMAESGAERVILVSGDGERLKTALEAALKSMSHLKGVIIEGNSPVDFLQPHLIIFIVKPEEEIKPSALKLGKRADIVVINTEKINKDVSYISDIIGENVKIFCINLINRDGEISQLLSYVKARISINQH